MPKDQRKRGRREEKKRKREDTEVDDGSKKLRVDGETDFLPLANQDSSYQDDNGQQSETPFYGLLNEEEQEYFSRADELLELNQFSDAEERALFLENVYREAAGKELKMANSQSCSRLTERLILLSTPSQLKVLFQKFMGQFLHLVQHRFASHCCETLFLRAAPVVSQENASSWQDQQQQVADDEVYVSMENLFLYVLNDLEGNIGYLMTDRFASHVLRILLIVLSGRPLSKFSSSPMQSKNKENISVSGAANGDSEVMHARIVPEPFHEALEKVIAEIVTGLDTNGLRALATHPTGSPVLQLLLELELSTPEKNRGKAEGSLLRKIIPDDPIVEGTESAGFLSGLVWDPVGSHLIETIVRYAPGKIFKSLYGALFKDKMSHFARNETASFIAIRILGRLSKEDLDETTTLLLPQIPTLITSSRNGVLKTLIDRCQVRGVDTSGIAEAFKSVYGDGPSMLLRLFNVNEDQSNQTDAQLQGQKKKKHSDHLHGSLLAQAMLEAPGQLSQLIYDGFSELTSDILFRLAEDATMSRALQASFTTSTSKAPYRRKIISLLSGHMVQLANKPAGSHVLDAIWKGTHNLGHFRERVAEELIVAEAELRDSYSGRIVWRNWMMDLYKRRKTEWIAKGRESTASHDEQALGDVSQHWNKDKVSSKFGSPKGGKAGNEPGPKGHEKVSGIEAARRRFAAAKAGKEVDQNRRTMNPV
ncbi:MAG: hypothetical protein M4579_006266 [Chaenotheca gracillima]|nr:MAG: hypothetical protein M4579_006266 [Chaenotheca gracillima]